MRMLLICAPIQLRFLKTTNPILIHSPQKSSEEERGGKKETEGGREGGKEGGREEERGRETGRGGEMGRSNRKMMNAKR